MKAPSKKLLSLGLPLLAAAVAGLWWALQRAETDASQLRDLCSCLYVMDRSEALCRQRTGLGPNEAKIDASARAIVSGKTSIRWRSSQHGCEEAATLSGND
jgi:hypothetical protein